MSKPRSHALDRHLVIHRLDAAIPFADLAGGLGPHLEARPALGLFLDPADGLIRLGGFDLHGDILIRPEGPDADRRLLVACRHGDRAVLDALLAATPSLWSRSDRAPSPGEGLALLNFLQSDPSLACQERIELADRAVDDAFTCGGFVALATLRRKLGELHTRAGRPYDLTGILWDDYNFKECLIEARANTPHTVLHRGEKVVLCLRERINARRGSSLTLHLTFRAERRTCVIGALTERGRCA